MRFLSVILPDYVLENQFSNTPEGVFRIHALVKMAGHDSQLLDLRNCRNDYEMECVVKIFVDSKFDICLVSATTAQGNVLNSFTKSLKAKFPNKLIVLGGTHVNAISNSMGWHADYLEILHPNVDCFAVGYYWTVAHIKKLISQMGKGAIIRHDGTKTKDIILRLPYEDLQNNSVSRGGGIIHRNGDCEEMLSQNMLFSVGCAHKCSFCFNEFTCQSRSKPSDVLLEISRRITRYGINAIKINDDDAFNNLKWNEKFIEQSRAWNMPMRYLASTRANVNKNKKKLQQLVELNVLGLSVLGIGVEWADDRVLEINNKRVTVKDIKQSIELLSSYSDIEILLYSIFGLPGMDDRAVDNMMEFIQWCKGKVKHISMTNFVPLIGTDIYENPEKYGMELMVPMGMQENIDWGRFYFNGKFDDIKALSLGETRERHLLRKADVYKCLDECGFLRHETKNDAIKAGYLK